MQLWMIEADIYRIRKALREETDPGKRSVLADRLTQLQHSLDHSVKDSSVPTPPPQPGKMSAAALLGGMIRLNR